MTKGAFESVVRIVMKYSARVNNVYFRERFQYSSAQEIPCYEPLQKLRVRLRPCKIDLNPPVTLCYCSFQVDTSVVVLFVLCLGV